ncbi:hypothetical protein FB567DRAFT_601640 [Paraphoma chrysanthemicola]|uniref:Uncharacterized protein n=1 Tax=Paraphoma chrysanthemicola TaxID=798071 RepID=A0A8K0RHY6_9PLEO|nr:hypothetical protein FB567DRAFT_601640 [Paraphoma chrysanthemicola]
MESLRAGLYFERGPVQHHAHEANKDGIQASNGPNTRQFLPYVETNADVTMINTTSHTVLTQTFMNATDHVIEKLSYCFPLYYFSIVTGFRFWRGMILVEGVVKPRKIARREFEDAIRDGDVGSLLEQHTSEIFETAIGNLQPYQDIKVEIQYVTELKADLTGYGLVLTIPASIAPRYGTPPEGLSSALSSATQRYTDGGIKIEVNVSMPVPVRSLKCRTHPVEVEMGYNDIKAPTSSFRDLSKPPSTSKFDITKAKARTAIQETTLKADYVLLIVTSPSEQANVPDLLDPRALIEVPPLPVPGLSALQVAFTPRDLFKIQEHPPQANTEIVLLVDLSGSMGPKLEALQQALVLFLRNLHAGCLFNICVFGTDFVPMWIHSKVVNKENIADAERYISKMKADMRGTELRNALQQTANRTRRNFSTQVVVFTDGELHNVDVKGVHHYVRLAKNKYGDTLRFFALGIGDNISHELVEGIGKFGGGFAEVVPVHSSEAWNDRIERMLNGVRTCSDWKIAIMLKDVDGHLQSKSGFSIREVTGNSGKFIQTPHYLPVVHGFSRTVVHMIIDAPRQHYVAVRVEATTSDGRKFSEDIAIEQVIAQRPVFHQFAAKALLYDIEMNYSWFQDCELASSKRALGSVTSQYIDQEAESIAMLWNLASKWTSFVAVTGGDQSEHQSRIQRHGPDRRNQTELKELMKPRKYGPTFYPELYHRKDKDDDDSNGPHGGGTGGGEGSGASTSGSSGTIKASEAQSTSGNSNQVSRDSGRYGSSRASGGTADEETLLPSLEQLEALQDHDGALCSDASTSSRELQVLANIRRCFKTDVAEALEWCTVTVNATERQSHQILWTFLCIIYMRKKLPSSPARTRIIKRADAFVARFIKKKIHRSRIENDIGRSWTMGKIPANPVHLDKSSDHESTSYFEVPCDTEFIRRETDGLSLAQVESIEDVQLRIHDFNEWIPSDQQHSYTEPNVVVGGTALPPVGTRQRRRSCSDPYSDAYSDPLARSYPEYAAPPPPSDPYGRPARTQYPQSAAPTPVPVPGYYIASDGRMYPLSQQPRNPGQGGSDIVRDGDCK